MSTTEPLPGVAVTAVGTPGAVWALAGPVMTPAKSNTVEIEQADRVVEDADLPRRVARRTCEVDIDFPLGKKRVARVMSALGGPTLS